MGGRPDADAVESELAKVAERIRQWRDESGLTLQELAQRSGVATSTIQKVETLQMVPTVAVLLKIARGLGRSASDFVSQGPGAAAVVHLTPQQRHPVGSARQMLFERLSGDLAEAEVELWRITLQPGHGSGRDDITYSGEELVVCEEGELVFRVGEEDYRLAPGDTLHFKASASHAWRNEGDVPARFLILGTVPHALRGALHRRLRAAPGRRATGRRR